jgi:hypothetical protein
MLEQGVSLCDGSGGGGRRPNVSGENQLALEQGLRPCGWADDGGHRPPASVSGLKCVLS